MGDRPVVVGVTGGIATGKTSVAREFERLGACRIDADRVARSVVRPGRRAWKGIVAAFGESVLRADGTVDRRRLGAIVFEDAEKRRVLEGIVHPEVKRVVACVRARAVRSARWPVVVLDVPLLYETGMDRDVDVTVVVCAPGETQVRRLRERDGVTGEEALARVGSQWPLSEKKRKADFVIDNSGEWQGVLDQIGNVWRVLTKGEKQV